MIQVAEAPDRASRAPDIDRADIDRAVQRAQDALFGHQSSEGTWRTCDRAGPPTTGWALVALGYLGALDRFDVAGAVTFVLSKQLPNGAFPSYPGDHEGTLASTATCYAGLYSARKFDARGDVRSDAMVRAWSYIAASGGFLAADSVTRTFLVAAGLCDPLGKPGPPMAWALIPGAQRALANVVNSTLHLTMCAIPGLLRGLKARRRRPMPAENLVEWMADQKLIAYLKEVQDPAGHWLGTLFHTALCAMTLHALGLPASDPAIARAVAYFPKWRYASADTNDPRDAVTLAQPGAPPATAWQFAMYDSQTWNTSLCVRALIRSGVPVDDPRIRRAVVFLLSSQGRLDEPRAWQNAPRHAPRRGGWPFEEANSFGLDCDSTGQVLAALAGVPSGSVSDAIDEGLAWLLGMQNPDGGWPAFGWSRVTKPPGPFSIGVFAPPATVLDLVDFVIALPLSLADPSTEDLTGRVLQGLGGQGYRVGNPAVDRAIAFLEAQVFGEVWWGRWECNYLPSSAYILCGLAAVGADLGARYVRRAVAWIEDRQNADGGFGETTDSYGNLGLAGVGPSTPYVTGLVASALMAAGGARGVIDRAIGYLLASQREHGLWPGDQYQLVVNEPIPFYKIPADLWTAPLQALADYRALSRGGRVHGVNPQ